MSPSFTRLLVYAFVCLILTLLVVTLRLAQVVHATHSTKQQHVRRTTAAAAAPPPPQHARLAVFLGSGGHTGEMIRLLVGVDFQRYADRLYVISDGDALSLDKVNQLEKAKRKHMDEKRLPFNVAQIPRARRVHQSFLTAPFSTLKSFAMCLRLFTLPSFLPALASKRVDLILLNGPGSCVPIVLAAFLPRIFALHSPQLLYVESLARVKRLSLSGKLVRPFVDRFLVQWEGMADVVSDPTIKSSQRSEQRRKVPWFLAIKEYRGILV